MTRSVARRRALAALAATPFAALLAADTARGTSGIPKGYEGVDPRTARRVPLWQQLSPANPIFEGDPEFTFEVVATIEDDGYLLEQITSLGTHTGTHVSAPAHFVAGGEPLSELDEGWTLMPLAVVDVARRVERSGGEFTLGVGDLQDWERRHGRIPAGGCVLLYTGFSSVYPTAAARAAAAKRAAAAARKAAAAGSAHAGGGHVHGHRVRDYFDPAPGFTGEAAAWLFDRRRIRALGSDTFGPDATSDADFSATSTALAKGGITVENAGPGLRRMRPFGDWVSINGARPAFSGFQTGITGFTR